jgi:predicted nuclease with TOPRIM domain
MNEELANRNVELSHDLYTEQAKVRKLSEEKEQMEWRYQSLQEMYWALVDKHLSLMKTFNERLP